MRIGSLFSGVGGLDQGLERAGVGRPAWFVEADPFCRAVLAARFPGVPCYEDVKAVDYSGVEPVEVLCGGPPCQVASVAGKRRGRADERWLWPEYARAVRALRPRLVFVENVSGLFTVDDDGPRGRDEYPRPFGSILGALVAEEGYRVRWACVRASDAGAPHRRERVFLVGVRVDVQAGRAAVGDADGARRAGRKSVRIKPAYAESSRAGDGSRGEAGRELADADDAGLGERRAGVAATQAQPAAEREGGDGGRGGEGDGALADADGRGRGEVGEPGDGRPVGGGRAGAGHPPATQDGGARALADADGERPERGGTRRARVGEGSGADDGRRADAGEAGADAEPGPRGGRARRGASAGADGALADAGDDGREGVAPVDGEDRRVGEPRGDDAARRGARGRGEGGRSACCATCGAPSPRHLGDCPWGRRGVERVGDAYLVCGCCGHADGAHDAGCGAGGAAADEPVGTDDDGSAAERGTDEHEREVADADGGDVRLLAERDQRDQRGEPAAERGDAEPRDAREDGGRRAQPRLGRGAHGVPGGVDGRAGAVQAAQAAQAEGAGRARSAVEEAEGAEEAEEAAGPDDLDLDLDDDLVDEGADLHVMRRAGVPYGADLAADDAAAVVESVKSVESLVVEEVSGARAISAWAGWPAPRGQPQRPGEPPRTTARFPNRRERLRVLGNAVVPAVGEVVGHWAMRLLREDGWRP